MVGASSFLTTKKEVECRMVGASSFLTTKKGRLIDNQSKSFGCRNANTDPPPSPPYEGRGETFKALVIKYR